MDEPRDTERSDDLRSPDVRREDARAQDMRVITVAMDIADLLLSMGVPAADVISLSSELCRRRCRRVVHVDTTSTLLTFARDGGIDEEALTAVRVVAPRPLSYRTVQGVLEVTRSAIANRITLDDAQARLHAIMAGRKRYPGWLQMVSAGLVSAGCAFLFGAGLLICLATFLVGCIGERCLIGMGRLHLPPLVAQAGAALVITLTALATAHGGALLGWDIDPTPVIAGGIVMLVVGLMFVGAFQDALDQFYLTAAARLFQVLMLTTGIVLGLLGGIWLSRPLGIAAVVRPEPLGLGNVTWQMIGAILIAAAYACYCHANARTVVVSGIVGVVVWAMFLVLWQGGMHEVPASGFAAVLAGLLAALLARRWRIPSTAITTAGIITMVPGLRLYSGLMQAASYPLWSPKFFDGCTTLASAVGVGLAIAIGASLGVIIGRPLKQRIALARNARAFRRLFRATPFSPARNRGGEKTVED